MGDRLPAQGRPATKATGRSATPAAGGTDRVYRLVEGPARELTTQEEILEATYAHEPLVSQTEIAGPGTGLRAVIEAPVKTMNTRRGPGIYQVDTGPVVLPDLSRRPERSADALRLAFVAFNVPGFADFVVEVPTPTGETPRGGRGLPLLRARHPAGHEPPLRHRGLRDGALRRHQRLQLQGVEGSLLPREASRQGDAVLLRAALPGRGDQQLLLPGAQARGGARLGGARARGSSATP